MQIQKKTVQTGKADTIIFKGENMLKIAHSMV